MKFLDTMYLSYIHFAYSLCYTSLAYSKETCVKYAVMTSLLLKTSTIFYCDIWSYNFITMTCAITLTPNPKF